MRFWKRLLNFSHGRSSLRPQCFQNPKFQFFQLRPLHADPGSSYYRIVRPGNRKARTTGQHIPVSRPCALTSIAAKFFPRSSKTRRPGNEPAHVSVSDPCPSASIRGQNSSRSLPKTRRAGERTPAHISCFSKSRAGTSMHAQIRHYRI